MRRAAPVRPPADVSAAPRPLGGEWRAVCDGCGASYGLAGWLRLAFVAHVESAWLATHVVGWQTSELVEVRRCARCAAVMSRRRPAEVDAGASPEGER